MGEKGGKKIDKLKAEKKGKRGKPPQYTAWLGCVRPPIFFAVSHCLFAFCPTAEPGPPLKLIKHLTLSFSMPGFSVEAKCSKEVRR